MNNLDQDIILRKLQNIVKYLNILRSRSELSQQEYLNSIEQQLIVERSLHLIVEAAADANSYLLVRLGHLPPETYYASFIKAGQKGIISADLAQQLAPSAGLRNRLVHEYDEIDASIVFQSISIALTFYPSYVEQIQAFLDHQNAT